MSTNIATYIPVYNPLQILRAHLLKTQATLENTTVNGGSDGEGTTDNGAETGQETSEGLGALFAVDDLHGGDVLRNVSHGCLNRGKLELT